MREHYRKKLSGYLEIAPDEAFLQLVWASNLLQAGRAEFALPYLRNVPPEAITEELPDPRFMHKWDLETIVGELLTVPKRTKPHRGRWRELDCANYQALIHVINALKGLANAESGARLKRINILREMPRLVARQIDWQRGWFNAPQFYRTAFIYGQGACADYFLATHGLSIDQFSVIGFALHTGFMEKPAMVRMQDISPLGISSDIFQRALDRLAIPIADARQKAGALQRRGWPAEYQPSLLRQYPCISFGEASERLRSPLPQLILDRVTAGIFYDVAGAGWEVREEYGRRFEQYSLAYLRAVLPGIQWEPEQTYKVRKEQFKSPDILWVGGSGLRLAVECKATRMSIDARYSEDPLTQRGYGDLVKAVFQLWRYFSHCRRGLTGVELADNATGLVLTIDSWLVMATALTKELLAAAEAMAAERDTAILPEDRRPILFCSIVELEEALGKADEVSFDAAISKYVGEQREGWMLSSIHKEVCPQDRALRRYPFGSDMANVLPWWGRVEEQREANREN